MLEIGAPLSQSRRAGNTRHPTQFHPRLAEPAQEQPQSTKNHIPTTGQTSSPHSKGTHHHHHHPKCHKWSTIKEEHVQLSNRASQWEGPSEPHFTHMHIVSTHARNPSQVYVNIYKHTHTHMYIYKRGMHRGPGAVDPHDHLQHFRHKVLLRHTRQLTTQRSRFCWGHQPCAHGRVQVCGRQNSLCHPHTLTPLRTPITPQRLCPSASCGGISLTIEAAVAPPTHVPQTVSACQCVCLSL